MTTSLYRLITPACAVFLLSSVSHAQELMSEAAKKEATEWLNNVKTGYLNAGSARLKKAIAALTTACGSESAAMKLYTEAMKDRFMNPTNTMQNMLSRGGVYRMRMQGGPGGQGGRGGNNANNRKQESPSAAFSNWRKENSSNQDPGFKKALQLQCKWMLLCLKKADAEKNEKDFDASATVISLLDELAADEKGIGEQIPAASAACEVIRNYLDIGDYRSEQLPDNMLDLNGIFDRLLLVPHKENKDVAAFRRLWNKRIALELALLQANSNADKKTAEQEKQAFLLKRQWEREKACFDLGDQVAAFAKMKTLLPAMQDPNDKQRAIRELEFLLLSKEEQDKITEERRNRRNQWRPGF